LSREILVELSMLMAPPNDLRLKNYNGSIAPSQLADAPARDGYSAWVMARDRWPMSLEAVRMFLGVQDILYHGEGVKLTLAVSYS
jgi:hypothetical protein